MTACDLKKSFILIQKLKQEAQLSHGDCMTHYVSWNHINCYIAKQKNHTWKRLQYTYHR